MGGGRAQLLEPLAIDSAHCSLAIHIRAEKGGAKWLKLFHYFFGSNAQFFSPSLDYNVALGRIERYDNCLAAHSRAQSPQKWRVYFALLEGSTSDNDLMRAPFCNFRSAGNGANASADAHFHPITLARFFAYFSRQVAVVAFSHGGVQVDHVKPLIFLEFEQQRHYIRDREFAPSAVHELHGLALLQVNTRNKNVNLTGIPRAATASVRSRIDDVIQ